MTVVVKSRQPLVVPTAVRRRAGLKSGQELEFRVSGGVITILPKLSKSADQGAAGQRRVLNAKLAEGLSDIKAGRIHGPFNSADEMIQHMRDRLKTKPPPKSPKRSR